MTNSASIVGNAMHTCFLLAYEMTPPSSKNLYSGVDFLLSRPPAQSTFIYPTRCKYLITNGKTWSSFYIKIFFMARQCAIPELDWNRTTYAILGFVHIILCIKLPTPFKYKIWEICCSSSLFGHLLRFKDSPLVIVVSTRLQLSMMNSSWTFVI